MYSYKTRGNKFKKVVILIFLVIFVSVSSIYIYDMYLNIEVKTYSTNNDVAATKLSTVISTTVDEKENIFDDVIKTVVGISKIQDVGSSILLMDSTTSFGLGTGTIISENGYIITNYHVAGDKYETCYVNMFDGKEYIGNIVWADEDLDLAIVKIDVEGLKFLEMEDSDNIKLGENVYAIGNPIGIEFQRTVTAGIVSGMNRTVKVEDNEEVTYMEDLIQTDASINSGNSGGPLINEDGKIIGINSVKITSAEGIGFAIPINIIKPIIESYIANDSFEEGYLGIFAIDKSLTKYLNENVEFDTGICVEEIALDGPCYNTGLKVGDIITAVDGFEINKMSELRNYIYTKKPGDEVTLKIIRNKKEYNLKITLGKKI